MGDVAWIDTELLNGVYQNATVAVLPGFPPAAHLDSQTIIFVNHVLLCSAVGLFGMAANVINLCVFVRQGLNSSLNISLLSIAVFDMIKIFAMQSINVVSNPLVIGLVGSRSLLDAFYLIGGWPAACAHRISMYITGYVTAERCLCVFAPLKIKSWITPRRACVVIFVIQIVNIFTLVPEYSSIYIDWVFLPAENRTVLGLAFASNRRAMQGLTFLIHVVFLVVGISVVICLTVTLVFLLKRKSEWRSKHTTDDKQKESLSVRDRKTSQLVILLASVLVACYLPMIILSMVTVVVPEFNPDGRLEELFLVVWSFGHIFGITNSSVNIFIYYNMSSNFRQKFRECFQMCTGRRKKQ